VKIQASVCGSITANYHHWEFQLFLGDLGRLFMQWSTRLGRRRAWLNATSRRWRAAVGSPSLSPGSVAYRIS